MQVYCIRIRIRCLFALLLLALRMQCYAVLHSKVSGDILQHLVNEYNSFELL